MQHPNFSAFAMDQSIQHSFRSDTIQDLNRAMGDLIEGEAGMKRALGRLWQTLDDVPTETPTKTETNGASTVAVNGNGNGVHEEAVSPSPQNEDGGELGDDTRLHHYTPDLTPPMHKIFLAGSAGVPLENGGPPPFEVLVESIKQLK
jgi:hypothetical protein